MTHTDHRMEAAQRTNQSNGRGWNFPPEPSSKSAKAVGSFIGTLGSALAKPYFIPSLLILAGMVSLLMGWGE